MEEPKVEEEEIPCTPESSDDSEKEAEAKKHDKETDESTSANETDGKKNEANAQPTSANKSLKKRRRIDDD